MPYKSNRLDWYQSCVFTQRLSTLLAVPICGAQRGLGAKLTGNYLNDQASVTIGELQ